MADLNLKDYITLVHKSGLLSKEQLQNSLQVFQQQTAGQPTEWRSLARHLIHEGLLTKWQNTKLVQGRYRGFFLGKYKLLSLLGSGGMSSVYLAEHTVMLRRVALKILPQKLVEDEVHLRRFYIESQATAALDHPNIVRAYDVDNEGKVHYLVMEFVDGPDLEKLVQEHGALSYELVADYMHQAAEGLAHAHAKGMIHRDIKPANLLVSTEGVIKILDMGLALLENYADSGAPETHVMGTTDYIAPEQALNSQQIDARADIYSLGCTMYYLLTGQPPFPEGTMAEVLLKHQMQDPRSIYEYREDAPEDLVNICCQMMAKNPDDRLQCGADVATALSNWLTSHQAWQGEPEHAKERTPEEAADLTDFLQQVDHDHEEKVHSDRKSPLDDTQELHHFLGGLRAQTDPDSEDSEPEMMNFLSGLPAKPSRGSGGLSDTVAISKQPTAGPTRTPKEPASGSGVRTPAPNITPAPARTTTPAQTRNAAPPPARTPPPVRSAPPPARTPPPARNAPPKAGTPAPRPSATPTPAPKPRSKEPEPEEELSSFFQQLNEQGQGVDQASPDEADLNSFLTGLKDKKEPPGSSPNNAGKPGKQPPRR